MFAAVIQWLNEIPESVKEGFIPSIFTLLGVGIGGFITYIVTNKQIRAGREEAQRQREFEEVQFKRNFVLQRKIEAYEFAMKELTHYPFPLTEERLNNIKTAISLLILYLPRTHYDLVFNFGMDRYVYFATPLIYQTLPSPNSEKNWRNAYEKLREYLQQEIDNLYNAYRG